MTNDMSEMAKQEMRKSAREDIKTLNTLWITEMVEAPSGLNEKMAFFWHDHFACKSPNPIFMQDYLDVIRTNALGNFGDLLKAVSKTPAMLQYLNNQQNKKQAPNENFAREVMELFTLGRDNEYTERDISEAARAFTGWGFNKEGEFVFRQKWHDAGTKTVLNNTGNLTGDDVLEILLNEKQTARYISQKWVRFFANEQGNPQLEDLVANTLYSTGYNIKKALNILFTSELFYQESNIGCRIKSPIELVVGIQRQLHVQITDEKSLIYLQRMMGQMLFDPPNVAGWPDGKDWVDSAALMFRMNLPELIFRAAAIQHHLEDSFDDNDMFKLKGPLKQLETTIDHDQLLQELGQLDPIEIENYLLQQRSASDPNPSDNFMDLIVFYTSKPEYQLC